MNWYLLFIAFANLGQTLFPAALEKGLPDGAAIDHDHEEMVGWKDTFRKIRGTRAKKIRARSQCRATRVQILIMTLVLEPVKHLTYYFLRCSKDVQHTEVGCMLDLASAETSPVWQALQQVSALLARTTSRLVLLWGSLGLRSELEWLATCPTVVASLRRAAIHVAAWLHERHHRPCAVDLPFRLGQLADERQPCAVRTAVAKDLVSKAECCVRHLGI